MKTAVHAVVFVLDDLRLALPLSAVERVVRAVEVTPLPQTPAAVAGVINIHGQIVPVVDLRRLLGMAGRDVDPGDHLIIARVAGRPMALLVDDVRGVMEAPGQDIEAPDPILPRTGAMQGVLNAADGVIPVCDIERLLSLEERGTLERALPAGGGRP